MKTVQLRDWKTKDLEIMRFWYSGHQKWMEFDGPYYPKATPKQLEERIIRSKEKIANNNWESPRERMVIATLEEDKFIGTVSWYWQSKETNWKSIGIAIYDSNYWSKGIGYEALQLWIDYLFDEDPTLVRLDLRTWSGNHGMIKLASKLGFKEEARFRKARIINGEYFDSIGMGILREEWDATKS